MSIIAKYEEQVTRAFFQYEQKHPPDATEKKQSIYVVRRALFESQFPRGVLSTMVDQKQPLKPAFTAAMDEALLKFGQEHAGNRIPWQMLLDDPLFEHLTGTDLRVRYRTIGKKR